MAIAAVFMSKEVAGWYEQAAAKEGLSVEAFIRRLLMAQNRFPKDDLRVIFQSKSSSLGEINQLTHQSNHPQKEG